MTVELRKQPLPEQKEIPLKSKSTASKHHNPSWGRASKISWVTELTCYSIVLFCPLMVIYFWLVCDSYKCSLSAPLQQIFYNGFSYDSIKADLIDKFPRATMEGFQLYAGWLIFQCKTIN